MSNPPILNNMEIIKSKLDMLDNLLQMEIAYSIIKSEDQKEEKCLIDKYYDQLKNDIELVSANSEEFNMISKYLTNTHGRTHSNYRLEIIQVFKLNRHGEAERFKKDIGNRHLLWHGSRTMNFAGILNQGLRIAPPEAPVNGYMFGKGIYTADMVSKSANYCNSRTEGLLILCDVALGEIQEEISGFPGLNEGKQSVKGIGSMFPNPEDNVVIEDGVIVPLGPAIQANDQKYRQLQYNEYIVYDEAQIQMKYLLRVKMHSNY